MSRRRTYTRQELAERLGCSERTIDRAKRDGLIRPVPSASPRTLYGFDALRALRELRKARAAAN